MVLFHVNFQLCEMISKKILPIHRKSIESGYSLLKCIKEQLAIIAEMIKILDSMIECLESCLEAHTPEKGAPPPDAVIIYQPISYDYHIEYIDQKIKFIDNYLDDIIFYLSVILWYSLDNVYYNRYHTGGPRKYDYR